MRTSSTPKTLSNSLTKPSTPASEEDVRRRLRVWLDPAFETHEEVVVRHALFRRRRLRVDVLAIPRDPAMSDIAIAFETKSDRVWDTALWGQVLKQASDYVLSTVEPELRGHAGKRVMATFVYPCPHWRGRGESEEGGTCLEGKEKLLAGMGHFAGYHRVGMASAEQSSNHGRYLTLRLGVDVWNSWRGWHGHARNVLVGKRQLGSQSFPILDELKTL